MIGQCRTGSIRSTLPLAAAEAAAEDVWAIYTPDREALAVAAVAEQLCLIGPYTLLPEILRALS